MALLNDQVLAFAALMQAVELALQLAQTGEYPHHEATLLIDAIYVFNPASTVALYPTPSLRTGLEAIRTLFNQKLKLNSPQQLMLRTALKLNALAKKLNHHPVVLQELDTRLQQSMLQHDFYLNEPDHIFIQLANTYVWLTQSLNIDLQIVGKKQILHEQNYVLQIRALLLAGLRAVFLWRQLGGNIGHLWWHRKDYQRISQELISPLT